MVTGNAQAGSCSTGGQREVSRGGRSMTGSSGGWSTPRGDEAAAVARDSSPTGVLQWLGSDERQTGMQEGSRVDDSMWREREWERSSPRGGAGSLLNRRRRKGGGGPSGRVHVEDGGGGREGGLRVAVHNVGRPEAAPDHRASAAPLPREQGRAVGRGRHGAAQV
jgi:hypothetical protein